QALISSLVVTGYSTMRGGRIRARQGGPPLPKMPDLQRIHLFGQHVSAAGYFADHAKLSKELANRFAPSPFLPDSAPIKSPYPAGPDDAFGSDMETTPGTKKLSAMKRRNLCGAISQIGACLLLLARSQGHAKSAASTMELTVLIGAR